MKLSQVIEELVEEKGLDRTVLSTIIAEGMLAAYKKKYPDLPLKVVYNRKTDEIDVSIDKEVVNAVQDEDAQISLRKARAIKENVAIGDQVELPFDGSIGRIEILKGKTGYCSKDTLY